MLVICNKASSPKCPLPKEGECLHNRPHYFKETCRHSGCYNHKGERLFWVHCIETNAEKK
jgi:hypothetical protein